MTFQEAILVGNNRVFVFGNDVPETNKTRKTSSMEASISALKSKMFSPLYEEEVDRVEGERYDHVTFKNFTHKELVAKLHEIVGV